MYDKFQEAIKNSPFNSLHVKSGEFLHVKSIKYKLSFQDIKKLIDCAIDLQMWKEETFENIWEDKENKKKTLNTFYKKFENIKNQSKKYKHQANINFDHKITLQEINKDTLGLGSCPVASPKTRCCNLMTLDAVESCGFDCSYCSIQSFYNQNKVSFDKNFAKKLKNLKLDSNKLYHIGTGQSSDSLMWGNKVGILEALFDFAKKNPNVVLELKTKSNNISYFLENEVPKNILVTWSLNPELVVENEEKLTASLDERINAARKLADNGVLVGFHFHPIIMYEGYLNDYKKIAKRLVDTFTCKEVILVSMGTLTFIKPVIKKLRNRAIESKILQMPLIDASGKLSYPLTMKEEMFKNLYDAFAPWHKDVYFYMCMEDISLWEKVFGREYKDNEEFEHDMITSYMKKINL